MVVVVILWVTKTATADAVFARSVKDAVVEPPADATDALSTGVALEG